VLATIAKRQRFSPTDRRAFMMIGRQEFQPILDGITLGLQALLLFIGTLTLTIGAWASPTSCSWRWTSGVREIGLRRALGARRPPHPDAVPGRGPLVLTWPAGDRDPPRLGPHEAARLPMFGPLFEDESGQGDLELKMSVGVVLVSTLVLVVVGAASGLIPALKASHLDPVERCGTSDGRGQGPQLLSRPARRSPSGAEVRIAC